MTSDLEAAAKAFRRAEKTAKDRYSKLVAAIVQASKDGVRQIDIVNITGYTRERIRQILREAAERERESPPSSQ